MKRLNAILSLAALAAMPALAARGRRFRFAVAPANSFGGHGRAIRSAWLTGDFGA